MNSSRTAKVALLRDVGLFADCTDRELRLIASQVDERRVAAGTVLAREGEPGDEFFVVAEGLARADIEGQRVGSIRPGSFFGEMALLDSGPRSATVTAELPTRLLVLNRREFSSLVEKTPSVCTKMLRALATRLRAAETPVSH